MNKCYWSKETVERVMLVGIPRKGSYAPLMELDDEGIMFVCKYCKGYLINCGKDSNGYWPVDGIKQSDGIWVGGYNHKVPKWPKNVDVAVLGHVRGMLFDEEYHNHPFETSVMLRGERL